MRFLRVTLPAAMLILPGCQWLVHTLIDGMMPTKGTSREPGISQEERQYRREVERIDETLLKFDGPRHYYIR